jgi:hypothetical protein
MNKKLPKIVMILGDLKAKKFESPASQRFQISL